MIRFSEVLHLLFYPLVAAVVMASGCVKPMVTLPPAPNTATAPHQWAFDTDPVGGFPQGATVFSGNWAVRSEPGTPSAPNALCQTGSATFPAMTLSDAVYTDVIVQTSFKPISGNTDRAAGIIFRVQDRNNYYIVRANALENNVNIYKYVNGSRITLKEGAAKIPSGQWQVLRIEVSGSRIRGFLNSQLVVETTDTTFKSGGVGLWTKADSVTCFDDIEVQAP